MADLDGKDSHCFLIRAGPTAQCLSLEFRSLHVDLYPHCESTPGDDVSAIVTATI